MLQNKKECYFCKEAKVLHKHHIYGGANRKISDKHNFTIYLCPKHHNMSNESVHFNKDMDLELKQKQQIEFELNHKREDFIKLIGKNYL